MGATVLQKSAGLLFLPYLSRILTPTDFGQIALVLMYSTFLSPIIQLQSNSYITYKYFQTTNRNKLVSSVISTQLIALIILYLPLVIFTSRLKNSIFILLPLYAFLQNISSLNLILIRNREEAKKYSFLTVLNTILFICLFTTLSLVTHVTWEHYIYVMFTVGLVFFVLNSSDLLKSYSIRLTLSNLKGVLNYSIPLIPAVLGISIINLSDRYLIEKFTTAEELGFYSIGYNFGMVITVLITAIQTYSLPTYYKVLGKKNPQELLIGKFNTLFIIFLIISSILLVLSTSFLIRNGFLPKQYSPTLSYLPIIAYSYVFWGICLSITPFLGVESRTKTILIIYLIGALINIILNLHFIPAFGAVAAAYSTLVTFTVMSVLLLMAALRSWERKAIFSLFRYTEIMRILNLKDENTSI